MAMKYAIIIVAAVLWAQTTALAQVDTSNWKCELCPFEQEYTADVEVGASYVSESAARFGNATGLDDKGGVADVSGEGRYASEDFRFDWQAEDLGIDARAFRMSMAKPDRFEAYLGYSELPYRLFDTTSTVFRPAPDGALVLPDGWTGSGTTGGMTDLDSSLRPQDVGSDRDTIDLGGNVSALPGMKLYADFSRQDRSGIDIVSGSNFNQAALLPRFFDYQTDSIDLGLKYGRGPLSLSLAWYGSFFENKANSLVWDNPFFTGQGAPRGQLAVEPDNDFQRVSLSGSYLAQSLDTVLAFNIAIGQGEQNEPLLPYTINPAVSPETLPRSTLDGKVDTASYSLTLTSRPIEKGRVRLSYRFDERDNRTASALWSRVIVDNFPSGDPQMNIPYSFERSGLKASGEYALPGNLRLAGGYERTELDRDFQEVAEQTEDDGWGRLRWQALDWLNVTAKGGAAKRDIDRYDETIAQGFGQNPLLRKYNLAYRYREYGEVTISASPAELPVSGTLITRVTDDSYSQSRVGLTASDSFYVGLDVGFAMSERTSAYLVAGRESIEAAQTGSGSTGQPEWAADHEDNFNHLGLGIDMRGISEKIDATIDYTRTDGETQIGVSGMAIDSGRFPDIDSTMDSIRLKLSYRHSDRLDLNFRLIYESFESNDWAIAGVEPDTIPSVLTLGADPYDYDVWVISLGFRYRIGEQDINFPE